MFLAGIHLIQPDGPTVMKMARVQSIW